MADKVRVTPQQGAEAWRSGFGAAGAKYERGIESVTVAPNAKAAAALPRYIASVTSKAVQDKYVAKNNAVTLESWKASAKNFGVPNLSRGAEKGEPKQAAFAAKFYPYLNTVLAALASKPNITLQDRIARAVFLMGENAKYRG